MWQEINSKFYMALEGSVQFISVHVKKFFKDKTRDTRFGSDKAINYQVDLTQKILKTFLCFLSQSIYTVDTLSPRVICVNWIQWVLLKTTLLFFLLQDYLAPSPSCQHKPCLRGRAPSTMLAWSACFFYDRIRNGKPRPFYTCSSHGRTAFHSLEWVKTARIISL
jgi:hypothetical protein